MIKNDINESFFILLNTIISNVLNYITRYVNIPAIHGYYFIFNIEPHI